MFRNAPIRTKLIVALLGPLLLLAVLALVGIRQNLAESDRAERSTAFARLAAGLAPLIHQLQAERSLSISYIDSGRRQWGPELLEQRRVVDQAAATYRAEAQRLGAGDELLAEKIEYGLSELGRLGEQRQTIDNARIAAERAGGRAPHRAARGGGRGGARARHRGGPRPARHPGQGARPVHRHRQRPAGHQRRDRPPLQQRRAAQGGRRLGRPGQGQGLRRRPAQPAPERLRRRPLRAARAAKLSALVAAEDLYTAQFDSNATEAQHEFREETVAGPEVEQVDQFVEEALGERHRA